VIFEQCPNSPEPEALPKSRLAKLFHRLWHIRWIDDLLIGMILWFIEGHIGFAFFGT